MLFLKRDQHDSSGTTVIIYTMYIFIFTTCWRQLLLRRLLVLDSSILEVASKGYCFISVGRTTPLASWSLQVFSWSQRAQQTPSVKTSESKRTSARTPQNRPQVKISTSAKEIRFFPVFVSWFVCSLDGLGAHHIASPAASSHAQCIQKPHFLTAPGGM